jgi:lipid-A-disaccharide synthase-like uncharacterized protein
MLLTILVGGVFCTAYAIFAGDPVFITINLLATTNTLACCCSAPLPLKDGVLR